MPPKKGAKGKGAKGKKVKTPAEEQREKMVRMQMQLAMLREECNRIPLVRDRIKACWETSKMKLEDMRATLRESHVEREKAQERWQAESHMYKQKLKHVQLENHAGVFEGKIDNSILSSLIQDRLTESEVKLREEIHNLLLEFRQSELNKHILLNQISLDNEVELHNLRNDHRITQMEFKHEEERQEMIHTMQDRTEDKINQIEAQIQKHLETFITDHNVVMKRVMKDYVAFHEAHVIEKRGLDKELTKLREQHVRGDKELSSLKEENKHLRKSLEEVEQKLPELHRDVEEDKKAKSMREESAAHVKDLKQELRELSVMHELLLQGIEKVEKQRNELRKEQTNALLDVQQKAMMREMQLNKNMKAMMEIIEKMEALLST